MEELKTNKTYVVSTGVAGATVFTSINDMNSIYKVTGAMAELGYISVSQLAHVLSLCRNDSKFSVSM